MKQVVPRTSMPMLTTVARQLLNLAIRSVETIDGFDVFIVLICLLIVYSGTQVCSPRSPGKA
jgi:hypothetical protein